MIENREDFERSMRQWAILDNKIRASNNELKTARRQKDELSISICNFMKSKGLENKRIDTGDSVITFCEKNEYQTLTFGYIEKCLGEIIEKDKVSIIMKHLRDKREVKVSNELRRRFNNNNNNNNNESTSGYE